MRGNSLASKVPPGQYMFSQLASEAGVSVKTLKRWHREGLLNDTGKPMRAGKLMVYLFDGQALEKAVQLRSRAK